MQLASASLVQARTQARHCLALGLSGVRIIEDTRSHLFFVVTAGDAHPIRPAFEVLHPLDPYTFPDLES